MKKENYAAGLDVFCYEGEGYQTMTSFGAWKVAMVVRPEYEFGKRLPQLSRHMETDEVFVLLCGTGTLYIAGKEEKLSKVETIQLEAMKVYNVKKGTWHAHSLEKDARLLIVENEDTGNHNSQFADLEEELY